MTEGGCMRDCRRPVLTVLVLLLVAVAVSCGVSRGAAAVSWNDPAGDVAKFANLPDLPLPDVTRVTVEAANGELLIVFKTNDPLAQVFEYTAPDGKKRGATLASLYLDTDNNASTGGAPFVRNTEGLAERKGYDRQISVQLGFLYADAGGGSGMSSGDVVLHTGEVQITAPIANYYVYALSAERQYARRTIAPESIGLDKPFRDLTRLGQDTLELRIPYAALGTKTGDTVRLCFHDAQQSSSPDRESVSDDLTLRLQ